LIEGSFGIWALEVGSLPWPFVLGSLSFIIFHSSLVFRLAKRSVIRLPSSVLMLRTTLFSLLVLLSLFTQGLPTHSVSAQAGFATNIQGTVTEASTGHPIAGAQVTVADLNLSGVTDAGGQFAWNAIPLPQATFTTTITITAPGFGDWTIQNIRLHADDTLLLTPQLGVSPTVVIAPLPRAERPEAPQDQPPTGLMQTLALDQTNVPLPATIRVRVTGWGHCDTSRPYTVQTIDFRTYLQHVLPNEWVNTWSANSLRAGAMAAKMYAWYMVAIGGKWPDADVYDSTCDQVYNPNFSYASTNAAIDYTWDWRLMRNTSFVITYYRAYYWQCQDAGLEGNCMGQYDSQWMAQAGSLWDEILYNFYSGSSLSRIPFFINNFALRFNGNGTSDIDRVKVQIDDPANSNAGPPADIGATDFTIEWWMKAKAADNPAGAVTCGYNADWIHGNTLIDRDRYNQDREYGISLAGGKLVLGIGGESFTYLTLCGTVTVADNQWHHVAVERQRSDGFLWIWVDGELDVSSDGPDGDISYPDDGTPKTNECACASADPYLIFGAKKHDVNPNVYPSYDGWLEEVRLSKVLRYTAPFKRPIVRFTSDANTVALYHFDNASTSGGACTAQMIDSSNAPGGPSHGNCHYGGNPAGPVWGLSNIPWPFNLFLPSSLN
jgi:hypothetical protein